MVDERVARSGPPRPMAHRMQELVEWLQRTICDALEAYEEDVRFHNDRWEHHRGGGGLTRVLEGGDVFEKAGVNTSAVYGDLPERMADALGVDAAPFFATGVSLVIHPRSPYVPTVHANFRYFALGDDLREPDDQWFGGGADMTPYYPYVDDVRHFHRKWRDVCERHPRAADYPAFKQACDDYFYLPHREETRGVGGIFYDYVRDDPEAVLAFSADAGEAFLRSYLPIVDRRRHEPYGEHERRFQAVRRGRYAEFNLLYDRGTRFGLETGGRTASILMSLPPRAEWHYDGGHDQHEPQARLEWFLQPRDWFDLGDEAAPETAVGGASA